jgi:hypothetical protein
VENDFVRAFGDDTIVDLWVEGSSRAVTVPRRTIEWFLKGPDFDATAMTRVDYRDFVRTHLRLISNAAAVQLRANPWLEKVEIRPGELGR